MDAPSDADTRLLSHVLRGELREAGTLLVRTHADEVYALCCAMVRDAALAEDLSQEVFARAFAALDSFRGEASVRTWILRIARNRCVDALRAQRREPRMEEEPDGHAVDEPSVADLLVHRDDVEAGLAALEESERALVVLRFGHGLGYPELAGAFGLAEGAVRMRVSRAVAKMRAALRDGAAPRERAPAPPRPAAPAAAAPPAPMARRRMAQTLAPSPFARSAPASLQARLLGMADAL